MKTEKTLQLEKQIYKRTSTQGVFGCFEVTIGWFGKERVDYMTYDTKNIFRCYEIKATKGDFNSPAKLSFLGHYNYYVMPESVYCEVKEKIPKGIGVYIEGKYDQCNCVKKSIKQDIDTQTLQILKDSMIRSLSRYFEEIMKNNDESYVKRLDKKAYRLERENSKYYEELSNLRNLLFMKFGYQYMKVIENMEDITEDYY